MTLFSLLSLAIFLAIAALTALTGILFKPGSWYRRLEKPSWTPPNLAFPIIWSVLYLCIAVSGWLVFERAGLVVPAFAAYGVQLVLNAAWSALFFGMRRPDLAFLDIAALFVAVLATIWLFAPISAAAAWLLAPYLAWVAVAAALNLSVWRRNPGAFAPA